MRDCNDKEIGLGDIVSLTLKENVRRAGTIIETFSNKHLVQVEIGKNTYILPSTEVKLIAHSSEL